MAADAEIDIDRADAELRSVVSRDFMPSRWAVAFFLKNAVVSLTFALSFPVGTGRPPGF